MRKYNDLKNDEVFNKQLSCPLRQQPEAASQKNGLPLVGQTVQHFHANGSNSVIPRASGGEAEVPVGSSIPGSSFTGSVISGSSISGSDISGSCPSLAPASSLKPASAGEPGENPPIHANPCETGFSMGHGRANHHGPVDSSQGRQWPFFYTQTAEAAPPGPTYTRTTGTSSSSSSLHPPCDSLRASSPFLGKESFH